MPTILPVDSNDLLQDSPVNDASSGEHDHGEHPNGEPNHGEQFTKLDPEHAIGRSVLMPRGKDGQRFRAKILERVDKYKDDLQMKRAKHMQYRVLVGHDGGNKWEEIVAYNDLVNFIETEGDGQDGMWRFKEILEHQGPLSPSDTAYKGSRWNVLVAWETGEITLEPLKCVQDDKVVCALYARKHNLLDEPGWQQFKKHARREKKLVRMANQAKLHSFRTAPVHMYGHLVPRNHDQAIEIDKQNGNTRWQDAEKEELSAILGYGTFNDLGKGASAPINHKKINVHFVYACKHDGRYKARLVAGGHLTDTPIDSVYSSVASLRGVRMTVFLAELNDLEFWSTDIGNAYLESNTMEKVYIIAGKEFACVGLEGHILVIVKALYGLKSSGARWWEVLADVLRQMGFKPSKAEKDIWMRANGDHYEYVVVYVDDLGVAAKIPSVIVEELMRRYGFKLKGTGPIQFHLGSDYFRDQHGVLCFAPKKYVEKMIETYVRMFGQKPKHYVSPLEKGDHPELDDSEELDIEGIKQFQSMIGALQWAVQIGRFDITTAVMTMSSFRANPRQGHLDRCKRIYGYLSKMRNAVVRVRTEEPDYSAIPKKLYDWEQSVYAGAEEVIPDDAPKPLGKPVVMTTFVDANLYHDLVNGKSVTGILHLFNKTVIDWYSKKQSTVETATYGSEFVAARTAMEQIIDLRLQLRYLGVTIKGSTMMFGDNESVVNSSSLPHARLHKRHTALSFHRVREGIAAGVAQFYYIPSLSNPADILSKQWGYQQAWPMLQPLLFWEGDTMGLRPMPCSQRHRPQQAGGEQRRVLRELGHVGPRQTLLRRQRRVTDQAVGPQVGHRDFQQVAGGLNRAGDLDAERASPEHAQVLAVQPHLGDVLDLAQIEVDGRRRIVDQRRRQRELLGLVGGGARVVLDAVDIRLRPVVELLEADRLGTAPLGSEIDGPDAAQFHRFRELRDVARRGSLLVLRDGVTEDDEERAVRGELQGNRGAAVGLGEGRRLEHRAADRVPQFGLAAADAEGAASGFVAIQAIGNEVDLGFAITAVDEIEERALVISRAFKIGWHAILGEDLAR